MGGKGKIVWEVDPPFQYKFRILSMSCDVVGKLVMLWGGGLFFFFLSDPLWKSGEMKCINSVALRRDDDDATSLFLCVARIVKTEI